MNRTRHLSLRFALLFLAFFVLCAPASAVFASVHLKVGVVPSIAGVDGPLTGRLLVFMKKAGTGTDPFGPEYDDPNAVWVTGIEVNDLAPGKTVDFDADALSFPTRFEQAPAGEYQIFALLDQNHNYTYSGPGGGDVYSAVVKTAMPASDVSLTLSKMIPVRTPMTNPNARVVEFESPMLSAFWGRPIKMQAMVVLPPSYEKSSQKYPAVYSIHGYGGTHISNLPGVDNFVKSMAEGKRPEMIYVYLNAHNSLGHHVFADSANNGPWGSALVKEFIPYLEKQFRMDAKPSGRFLTGHSSGGWSSLWVMVTHPDFFAGTWSTSPDPVDFRNFTGPDLTRDTPANFYSDAGKDYPLVRKDGRDVATLKQYAQQEVVLGSYGGQMASFEAVFSPKGPDGRPMPLFDRETGRVDPFVQAAWQKYNIAKILRDNWSTLGPRLKGKIHIAVGTADTFHLDEPTRLLDAELKALGSDARFEYLEGKTHFDLYKDGLAEKFAWEMYKIARPKAKVAAK